MLARLALGNIRRARRDHSVYAATLVIGVAVFYAFNTIAVQADFLQGDVSQKLAGIRDILTGVTIALAVVMGFLMVYANGFLMRRRTRELGLYQMLGMRLGQVNLVLILETLVIALFSLAAGIAAGALLSQLMVFVTAALFRTNVSHFRFFFSPDALALTAGCFVLMFLVMMAFNTLTLRKVRLVELADAGRRNEKGFVRHLPASIALFAAGVALIATAYARLSAQGIPGFAGDDMSTDAGGFAITTALVTAGTIALFFGLAGTATGILSRLRGFYWRGLNLFTVRQLAARINTGAFSMAIIAMVLFLAVTSVTTGMIMVRVINAQTEDEIAFDASIIAAGHDVESVQAPDLAGAAREAGIDVDSLGQTAEVSLRYALNSEADATTSDADHEPFSLARLAAAAGQQVPAALEPYEDGSSEVPFIVSLSDFNANRRLLGLDPVSLAGSQYLMIENPDIDADGFFNAVLAAGCRLPIQGTELSPARATLIDDASKTLMNEFASFSLYVLVVPDAVAEKGIVYQPGLNVRYPQGQAAADAAEAQLNAASGADRKIQGVTGCSVLIYTARDILADSQTTTGLVIYLALYIGFVLVIACAAILAIQQLSAASDSARSYRTLGELGCPERMMWRSLRAQAVIAFLAPLAVGLCHSVCALLVIKNPIERLGYTGLASGAWVTVAIFVLAYGGYLALTCHAARGIVRAALRTRRHDI